MKKTSFPKKKKQDIILTFEDHGQDFLKFTVREEDGRITDAKPFQKSIWSKYKVTNLKELYVNGFVKLMKVAGAERFSCMTVKYPIESID